MSQLSIHSCLPMFLYTNFLREGVVLCCKMCCSNSILNMGKECEAHINSNNPETEGVRRAGLETPGVLLWCLPVSAVEQLCL